ncbi:MAG: hypothetical protein KIT48_08995 [Pseudolabrys sp.]|nr:hypothetical protein [Pseudolabrys sp.]
MDYPTPMPTVMAASRAAIFASNAIRALTRDPLRFFESYLFRSGGAYSIAACRIALFGYLLIHVFRDIVLIGIGSAEYYQNVNLNSYHAKSLVYLLFPTTPPPVEFLQLLTWIAGLSTVMAIVGLTTRWAMVASTLSITFLASIVWAWQPLWSHPYNSGLLAA